MSAHARREYVQAMYARYRQSGRAERGRLLTEFCAVVGYHRKSAIRLFNGPAPGAVPPPRRRPVHYEAATIEVLRAVWEAAGYPWSLRLKALLPSGCPGRGGAGGCGRRSSASCSQLVRARWTVVWRPIGGS
jgi:hypothetical protein